jgi:hypothetical protein
MLSDAGEQLQDASGGGLDGGPNAMVDAASAQGAACGTCTAGERQMVVTADQDLQQLRSGTIERAGWTFTRNATPVHATNCNVDLTYGLYNVSGLRRPTESRTIFGASPPVSFHGARIQIADDETLCAIGNSPSGALRLTDDPGTASILLWSGFVPLRIAEVNSPAK